MKRIVLVLVVVLLAGAGIWLSVTPSAEVARVLIDLERTRVGLESKTLETGDLRVAYLEGGSGEALVLLHGIGADKDHWTRVAPYLTPHFRVIAIDLPGFGDSDRRPDRSHTPVAQVENLRAIVRALGLEEFHLGGNSMGGLIAAEYGAHHPSEVRSLWLLAPAGVGPGPTGELHGLQPGERVPLFARSRAELEQVIPWVMSKPPMLPGPVKQALADRGAADYDLHVQIFREINDAWLARPLERTMAGSRIPTRIVWGEDDRLLPVSGAQALADAMPGASVLRLPGIGHLPMLEAAKIVGEDYVSFVAEKVTASP